MYFTKIKSNKEGGSNCVARRRSTLEEDFEWPWDSAAPTSRVSGEKLETENTGSLGSFCCKGEERNGAIAGDELKRGFFPSEDGRNDGKDPGINPLWPKIPALPQSYIHFRDPGRDRTERCLTSPFKNFPTSIIHYPLPTTLPTTALHFHINPLATN